MEVAAEPPALGVTGLDEPRAGGAQRLQPRAQLDLQARVLDRQRGRGRGVAQQLGRLAQRRRRGRARRRAALVSISVRTRPGPGSAAGRPVAVDVAARRAASRRPRASGRRAPRRARRARCAGRRRAARSRGRRSPCGRSGCAPARAGTPRGTSANAAKNSDLARPRRRRRRRRSRRRSRDAEREDHRAEQQHRLQAAALDRARGPPAVQQDDDRRRRSRTARAAPGSGRRHATALGRRRSATGSRRGSLVARREQQQRDLQRARRCSRPRRPGAPQRPSTRPDGNASSRWISREMLSGVEQRRRSRTARRRVEELQAGQRDAAAPTSTISAPVWFSGPPQPGERADADEAPGHRRRRCRGSRPARAAGVDARRLDQQPTPIASDDQARSDDGQRIAASLCASRRAAPSLGASRRAVARPARRRSPRSSARWPPYRSRPCSARRSTSTVDA